MRAVAGTLEQRVLEALAAVPDPEIPTCSIVDLGMVERVRASEGVVEVDLLPTFLGCPAKDVIGQEAEAAVRSAAEEHDVRVRFVYDPPWTSDRITEAGRAALRAYGLSPHWEASGSAVVVPLLAGSGLDCPYCGSADTVMDASFGPTPCRTAHFCRSCRNPFEGFKRK